jgi:hypothetical protein
MLLALLVYGPSPTPDPASVFDESMLQTITAEFFEQSAIQALHDALAEPISETIAGTISMPEDRLTVRPLAAHWMAAALVASASLAGVMAVVVSESGILPQAPNTIAGVARNLAQ